MDNKALRELKLFVLELSEEENLRTTVSEAFRASLLTGAGAAVGALLLGPFGIFAGATLMGGVAYGTCNNFQPLHRVLADMPQQKWERLGARVRRVMEDRGVQDIVTLVALATGGTTLREQVVLQLLRFAQEELGATALRQ